MDAKLFALIGSTAILLVAIVPLVVWRRRCDRALSLAVLGAGSWIVAVALKVAWAIPMNTIVLHALTARLGGAIGMRVFVIYVGVLTGVFEVGLVAIVARLPSRLRRASWNDAILFGIAFAGIEAVAIGVVSFVKMGGADVHLAGALMPPLERLSALVVHVLSCVLVVRGLRTRTWRALAAAMIYKSAVDAFAAWGILSFGVTTSTTKHIEFELVIAGVAALSLVALRWMHTHANTPSEA